MTTHSPTQSPLRTREECAAFCRCSPETFDRHVRRQLPPPRMVGRRPFWLQAWLDEWAAGDVDAAAQRQAPRRVKAAESGGIGRASAELQSVAAQLLTAGQRVRLNVGTAADLEKVRTVEERRAARAAAIERLKTVSAEALTEAERHELRRVLTYVQRVQHGLAKKRRPGREPHL